MFRKDLIASRSAVGAMLRLPPRSAEACHIMLRHVLLEFPDAVCVHMA